MIAADHLRYLLAFPLFSSCIFLGRMVSEKILIKPMQISENSAARRCITSLQQGPSARLKKYVLVFDFCKKNLSECIAFLVMFSEPPTIASPRNRFAMYHPQSLAKIGEWRREPFSKTFDDFTGTFVSDWTPYQLSGEKFSVTLKREEPQCSLRIRPPAGIAPDLYFHHQLLWDTSGTRMHQTSLGMERLGVRQSLR